MLLPSTFSVLFLLTSISIPPAEAFILIASLVLLPDDCKIKLEFVSPARAIVKSSSSAFDVNVQSEASVEDIFILPLIPEAVISIPPLEEIITESASVDAESILILLATSNV